MYFHHMPSERPSAQAFRPHPEGAPDHLCRGARRLSSRLASFAEISSWRRRNWDLRFWPAGCGGWGSWAQICGFYQLEMDFGLQFLGNLVAWLSMSAVFGFSSRLPMGSCPHTTLISRNPNIPTLPRLYKASSQPIQRTSQQSTHSRGRCKMFMNTVPFRSEPKFSATLPDDFGSPRQPQSRS